MYPGDKLIYHIHHFDPHLAYISLILLEFQYDDSIRYVMFRYTSVHTVNDHHPRGGWVREFQFDKK